jgi:hypothetical protein
MRNKGDGLGGGSGVHAAVIATVMQGSVGSPSLRLCWGPSCQWLSQTYRVRHPSVHVTLAF